MEHNMEWEGKYKSELLMVCHMDAQALHNVGAISDKEMFEYNRDCLVSSPKIVSESTNVPKQNPMPIYADPGSRCSSS